MERAGQRTCACKGMEVQLHNFSIERFSLRVLSEQLLSTNFGGSLLSLRLFPEELARLAEFPKSFNC